MTVREFADAYLMPYKTSGNEIKPKLCPFCHGGGHQDAYTFALNAENQTYNCKRGSCGKQGHFSQLLKEFGIENRRQYEAPKQKPLPVTTDAERYLGLRAIDKATAEAYRVGTDAHGNLLFPYFDETGAHVFNKFRYPRKLADGDKKAWREAGTKPVLFGMHLCDPAHPLTICEGEFDAMSCHAAGIPNAVSVPSGAEDLNWIDTCWDFLQQYDTVYLFGDNDEPGREMIRKLTARLSRARIHVVEHLGKDANELLYRQGKEAVLDAWTRAREVPIAGLLNLADVRPLDVANQPKARTSITWLNQTLGGFLMGDVTVWTGKRGEGKSTLLSQVLLDAVADGFRVCAYSGELRADRFQYWTDVQAAGPEGVREYQDDLNNRTVTYVPAETRDMIHRWYDGKYWLYDNGITIKDEEATVLKVFEKAAQRHDCKVFLIDNLMTVDYGASESDYYLRQEKFIKQLAGFANLYNVHVHLVAHPRKTQGGKKGINDSDEVGGSGSVTNRAANVIAVSRVDSQDAGISLTLDVLKNRAEGKTGAIGLCYEPKSRRIYAPSDGVGKQYGWEHYGCTEIEQTASFDDL